MIPFFIFKSIGIYMVPLRAVGIDIGQGGKHATLTTFLSDWFLVGDGNFELSRIGFV